MLMKIIACVGLHGETGIEYSKRIMSFPPEGKDRRLAAVSAMEPA
jgi:hypothetical protein